MKLYLRKLFMNILSYKTYGPWLMSRTIFPSVSKTFQHQNLIQSDFQLSNVCLEVNIWNFLKNLWFDSSIANERSWHYCWQWPYRYLLIGWRFSCKCPKFLEISFFFKLDFCSYLFLVEKVTDLPINLSEVKFLTKIVISLAIWLILINTSIE